MADFKTHITTSTALGVALGGVGHFIYNVPLEHAVVAGGLCGVAGMLPDLDSKSGIPQREMLSFAFRRKRRCKTQFSTISGNAMSVVNCTFYRGFEDCTYGFAATNLA